MFRFVCASSRVSFWIRLPSRTR